MLAPTVPQDWKTINGATTAKLWTWARKADLASLEIIRKTAATRKGETAKALVEFCDMKLGDPPRLPLFGGSIDALPPLNPLPAMEWTSSEPPARPWYKRRAFYVVTAILGAVGMGIGHGAGEQIWHWIWPTVNQMVGL